MFVDNPSYFYHPEESQPKPPQSPSWKLSLFKKRSNSANNNKIINGQKIKTAAINNHLQNNNINNNINNMDMTGIGSRGGSLKNLFRSKQSQLGAVYSQGIIYGESRPIDQQQNQHQQQQQRRSVDSSYRVSSCSAKQRERLGSYNESICYNNGNDDVFLNNSSDYRPQNVSFSFQNTNDSSISDGIRRHSIGTFINNNNRERLRSSSSFSDEVPKMKAPKPPTAQSIRAREEIRKRKMDDILFITSRHSERGIQWTNHLKKYFDQITKKRGRLPFNFLHIKIDEVISTDIAQRCLTTKLQIIALCPSLLAIDNTYLMKQLSAIIQPTKVVGIVLDVPEEKLSEIHRQTFPSYKKWHLVVNRDQSFIGKFFGVATDILGSAFREQPLVTEAGMLNSKLNQQQQQQQQQGREPFTIFPRKVKLGQNKVVALLSVPLIPDDVIKVKIEKIGQIIDVKNVKRKNSYTLQFLIPDTCLEVSMIVIIKIEKNGTEIGSRPVKCECRLRELEQILKSLGNPMEFMCQSMELTSVDSEKLDLRLVSSFQKNVPANFHLCASSDEKSLKFSFPRCSPEEYPTLLHFGARWGLERLCIQLLECPGGDNACEIKNCSGKTPIELAETFGHTKLAASLKNFSQMHEFTTMYHYFKEYSENGVNKTVLEMKMPESQKYLASKIDALKSRSATPQSQSIIVEGYMEMNGSNSGNDFPDSADFENAVTNLNYINMETETKDEESSDDEACSIEKPLKELNTLKTSEEREIMSKELTINEPAYYESTEVNKTDEFSQACLHLLENCHSQTPSECNSDYLLQPSNKPVKTNEPSMGLFGDYLTSPSNIPVPKSNSIDNGDYLVQPSNRQVVSLSDLEPSHLLISYKKKSDGNVSSSNDSKPKASTLKRQGSNTSKTSVDDELLEIINDFKNNVFTIQEVEQLVASWRNRNDVQQSFKDKQDQLQKMREEYERLQSQMKERMKRSTPFERLKKLFVRNRSSSRGEESTAVESNADETRSLISTQSTQRPMSSLSLHSVSSSSSSGRLSTGSACSGASLGDSGTHSDHEERRAMFSTNCRVGHPGSLMDNYLIPPAPRPVTTPVTTPTSADDKDRASFPNSRTQTPTNSSDHYIFFPSNVPVHHRQQTAVTETNDIPMYGNEYINFPGLKTIQETKETPHDTCVTVQPIKVQKHEVIYSTVEKRSDLCSSFKPNINNNNNNNNSSNISYNNSNNNNNMNNNNNSQYLITNNVDDIRLPSSSISLSSASSPPTFSSSSASSVSSSTYKNHDHINPPITSPNNNNNYINNSNKDKNNNYDNTDIDHDNILTDQQLSELCKNINELDCITEEKINVLTKSIEECNKNINTNNNNDAINNNNSNNNINKYDLTKLTENSDNNHAYMNI